MLRDVEIASALKKVFANPYSKKKVSLEEQEAQREDRFFSGRQIAFMIYEYFRVSGAGEAAFDCYDLFSASSQGDDIQDFATRWDQALLCTSEIPVFWKDCT